MLRVLCLGNELLADDAVGMVAAASCRRRVPELDVVFTADSGFHLMDYVTDVDSLVVIDAIQTGAVPPGTLYLLRSSDMRSALGPSPHYVGLLETLELAKELLLNVPDDVIFLAIEASDCLTLGGPMHDAVRSAAEIAADLVAEIVRHRGAAANCGRDSGGGLTQAIAAVSARWGSERLVLT